MGSICCRRHTYLSICFDRGSKAIDRRSVVFGSSPIFLNAFYGPLEAVALLLDRGSQAIDTPNIEGVTALGLACFMGRTDMVRLLLDRGSNAIDTPDKYELTPFLSTLIHQHQQPELARLLLDRGADRQGTLISAYALTEGARQ